MSDFPIIVENYILLLRNQKVMLDRDLAELYGVETKYLNRQVKRNQARFPEEFVFQLTKAERDELVTNWHRLATLKHTNSMPYAFTEHGVAMLASLLKGERAVQISIYIINTFIKLRELLLDHKELALKVNLLEQKTGKHDSSIKAIIEALQKLIQQPAPKRAAIGYKPDQNK